MTNEPYQVHLLIVEDDSGRREIVLDSSLYSVGRDPRCDIRLISNFASRRHATLVQLVDENGHPYYRIVDGNLKGRPSSNGLRINGEKMPAHDLQDGDTVVFGPQVQAVYFALKGGGDASGSPESLENTLIHPKMASDSSDVD